MGKYNNEKIDISVVVPVYGCPEAIPELVRRNTETLQNMGVGYEIILVDDRDGMGSWDAIKKEALADEHVKAISLTRNCGQDKAITAGVAAARGDWIVTMDCDLQDAPENIPMLYEKVRKQELDVLIVRRHDRKDSAIVQLLSKVFHKVFSYLSELDFDYELGTYLIASKRATDLYVHTKGQGRDFTMFLLWTGYKKGFVDLEHETRFAGKSSYTFGRKVEYALRAMTTFSNRVLYVPVYVGAISAIGSLIYIIFVLISWAMHVANPEGWNTLAAAVFFFGGLILSTLGVLGIYIGNIFDVAKERPLYIVQEKINIPEEK
ncbi:glycosyltransferase family 2 protein [Butyrivibrio sp. INlla14]|uniref:glycosyltransferase family 2 protein n=1 Tax=Butyrivibrio sp. INlla14 TaxID=1520808 RepID=UPI000876FC5F|nr:glycosyltransferase family 2 protein [Butyrivibrio sp. INlla14]SCY75510.1 dolichol-phosphate mannosyltransferase [Butyrivibrio sp. INlla14]